jgi:hypothetical protein
LGKSRPFFRKNTLDLSSFSRHNQGEIDHLRASLAKPLPSWIDVLASQLSTARGEVVSADDLYQEFATFRNECEDPILRHTYPLDIHHFKRSRRPQASTRDIILSFMDKRYRDFSVPMVTELAEVLDKQASRETLSSEFEKVLKKECIRRYTTGAKRVDSYWGITQRRIQEKYAGIYALLRIDSRGCLQAEPFAISVKQRDPIRISSFWLCEDRGRVGDLLVNTYRFSGLTVAKSTDSVIEPVSISLLRAPHGRRAGRRLPLVLGGFAVGWKDDDDTALFHSRIALIKLGLENISVRSYSDFEEAVERSKVAAILQRLLQDTVVQDNLSREFLTVPDLAMSQTDASDALAAIDYHRYLRIP